MQTQAPAVPATKPLAPSPVAAAMPQPGAYLIAPDSYDRRRFLGSSDIASILGVSPYRSALDCWLDKTQGAPDIDNPATRRGKRMEPVISAWAQEDFGIEFLHANRRFAHPRAPYQAAEIDREYKEGGEFVNVEIKSVHPFAAREWGEQGTDGLPLHYLCQARWGLHVTGRGLCVVFAGVGDELKRFEVPRDDSLIAEMSRQGADFWSTYVKGGLRPDIDPNHARVFETIRRLFPGTNGQTVTATPALEHWYAVLQEAAEKAKQYESVADGAKAHIVAEMGEAAQMAFADGQAMKRAKRERKGYEVAATEYWDIRLGKLAADKPAKGKSKPEAPALIDQTNEE